MAIETCPKCEKKLPPPFKSSGRQVCSGCGWTDKPKKVSPPEPEPSQISEEEELEASSVEVETEENSGLNSPELKSLLNSLDDVDNFQELFQILINQTIGINYKEPMSFEAAMLLEAKSQYFTILGGSTQLKYRFPYRNIMFISNAQDTNNTIAIGDYPQKNFSIIVQINHLVVYTTQNRLNPSGLIGLGLSFL